MTLADANGDTHQELIDVAMKHLDKVAVVVIAGGIGERLGYQAGIKMSMPYSLIDSTQTILDFDLQVRETLSKKAGCKIPYIIVTSDLTND